MGQVQIIFDIMSSGLESVVFFIVIVRWVTGWEYIAKILPKWLKIDSCELFWLLVERQQELFS